MESNYRNQYIPTISWCDGETLNMASDTLRVELGRYMCANMWGGMQTTWENNSQAHFMFCSEKTVEEQQ